jgi:hypothetical protein
LWGQSFTSATVQSQLDFAEDYIYSVVGPSRVQNEFLLNSDTHIQNVPKRCCISIAAYRLLALLSGGTMIQDFTIRIENTSVDKGNFPAIFMNVMKEYQVSAYQFLRMMMRPSAINKPQPTSLSSNGIVLASDAPPTIGGGNISTVFDT